MPLRSRLRRFVCRKKIRGCIYARFSTRFQHSIEDQVRKCREWAAANDIDIKDCHVFADRAVTGKTHKRSQFKALLGALERNEVDVVITFATNRLFRKLYRSLQFVEEEIVDRSKRCVFVAQNIDTKDDFWRQLLSTFATHDEMQVQALAGQVRAAHEGLLLKGWVWGTLPFGYVAMAVEGHTTRLGKPRTTPYVDEELRKWVVQIFRWFVEEGRLSFKEIARRLGEEKVKPPPRVKKWTWKAVKYLLRNRRYVGDWSYGWTESKWQNKAGYSRQQRREEPRLKHRAEGLRVVTDELFFAAQDRLNERAGRGGRPSHKGGPRTADPLVEVVRCPKHDRRLSVCGPGGSQIACPECKAEEEGERLLYSVINRKTGRRQLCETLARHVLPDGTLAEQVVAAATAQIAGLQEPDAEKLAALEKEVGSISGKIRFALENPGETETDQAEQKEVIERHRAERRKLEARIRELRTEVPGRKEAPTVDEIRALLCELGDILTRAASSEDADELGEAMAIILALTGGEIVLSQGGEAKRKCGWLRGRFRLRLVDTLLKKTGCGACGNEAGPEVVIDFREPTEAEKMADEAKALWDEEKLVKQIAAELSKRHGRRIGRNLVKAALDHWHESRGLGPCPDGRRRRSALKEKHVTPPRYQQIADEVKRLSDAGEPLYQIARRPEIDCDRNTLTQAIRFWHESRGLPLPCGRGRRAL